MKQICKQLRSGNHSILLNQVDTALTYLDRHALLEKVPTIRCLQKEFEDARASQTQEIFLDGEQWNDRFLVHMKADIKEMSGVANNLENPQEKINYKVGSKVICSLEGARIGIKFETSFACTIEEMYFCNNLCELYQCVLESKSFLEKMTVLEHKIPFFLPIREAENELFSSNGFAFQFIHYIGELLQAYVDRREHKLYGNQIGELYHSLPYHMIEIVLDDYDCLPIKQSKKNSLNALAMNMKDNGIANRQPVLARLSYAKDALRTMSLLEAYTEIVLNLPRALQ
ncbi:hypothetical protein UlMin_027642 [Ulmus minor]